MIKDLIAAERRLAGRAAVGVSHLGRYLRSVAEGSALRAQPFAEDRLARSAAVRVGGVEPAKPDVARMIEQLQRPLLAVTSAAQAGRRADPAEIAAAEPDPGDVALAQHPATFRTFALPVAARRAKSRAWTSRPKTQHRPQPNSDPIAMSGTASPSRTRGTGFATPNIRRSMTRTCSPICAPKTTISTAGRSSIRG